MRSKARRKAPPTPPSPLLAAAAAAGVATACSTSSRQRGINPKARLVQKYGFCNISLHNVPKQHQKYFRDIFTTVVEMKWRWCFFVFSLLFVFSWSLFAFIYYSIILYHGDFENGLAKPESTKASNGFTANYTSDGVMRVAHESSAREFDATASRRVKCVENVEGFVGVFIFSFATQSTVGYGHRYPSEECASIVVAMCVQWVCGLISQTLMAGVVFAKLARPIKRAATILFSKNAVICQRDGKLCLLFRVGDMRKSLLAEAHIRLQMIKKCTTAEGELLPYHQFDLNVGYDSGLDRVFVIWPITICHEIDASSPLYELGKETLATAQFEIIAILEGVVESVGSTTQARTSYLPDEILWGKRFEKLVTYQAQSGVYRVDFAKFHNVCDAPMPNCSAKELDQLSSKRTSQIFLPAINIKELVQKTNNNNNATFETYDEAGSVAVLAEEEEDMDEESSTNIIPPFTMFDSMSNSIDTTMTSATTIARHPSIGPLPNESGSKSGARVGDSRGAASCWTSVSPSLLNAMSTTGTPLSPQVSPTLQSPQPQQQHQSQQQAQQQVQRQHLWQQKRYSCVPLERRPALGLSLNSRKSNRLILSQDERTDSEQSYPIESTNLLVRAESPESKQRRKASFQIRRGPDLF